MKLSFHYFPAGGAKSQDFRLLWNPKTDLLASVSIVAHNCTVWEWGLFCSLDFGDLRPPQVPLSCTTTGDQSQGNCNSDLKFSDLKHVRKLDTKDHRRQIWGVEKVSMLCCFICLFAHWPLDLRSDSKAETLCCVLAQASLLAPPRLEPLIPAEVSSETLCCCPPKKASAALLPFCWQVCHKPRATELQLRPTELSSLRLPWLTSLSYL